MQPWKIAQTPEEAGLSSEGILSYLDAVEASGIEHHSILVLKNGMNMLTPDNLFLLQFAWLIPGVLIAEWTRTI